MRYLYFFVLFITILSCGGADTNASKWKTLLDGISLRESPAPDAREICTLKKGMIVSDLGETSAFISAVQVDNQLRQAPWLKIKTADGQQGWIPGSVLQPEGADGEARIVRNLAWSYFGKTHTEQCATLKQQADTSALVLLRALALRDTLNDKLLRTPHQLPAGVSPDFTWLNGLLPGFSVQWLQQGRAPHLFADYRFWLKKGKTPQDQAFFQLCLAAFPLDSVESFFPAWIMQTAVDAGCSNLGAGKHLDFLRQMNAIWGKTAWQPALVAFKNQLLEDIAGKDVLYWQPREKIVKEMIDIINAGFWCFGPEDQLVLKERLRMFSAPEKNGLRVNLRSTGL